MNRIASHSVPATASLILVVCGAACGLIGCAASLGPGYSIISQQIHVAFQSQPAPHILVDAEYHLKNVGNQDLQILAVRLPGRRFRPANVEISWDGSALTPIPSEDHLRDTVLRFPGRWSIGATHSLHFSYEISPLPQGDDSVGISQDAFYLPAEAWAPQLPQPRGVFGFGGVPPKKWNLIVNVPQDFLVHASGGKPKSSRKGTEREFLFRQTSADLAPFVVAGGYRELRQDLAQGQQVHLWTRAQLDPAKIWQQSESFAKSLITYDSLFGARGPTRPPLWIVECPTDFGCRSRRDSVYSSLLFGHEPEAAAEMISQDTALVLTQASTQNPETLAAPALAAGWLGYGQNPGFYEQQLPMSALPAFAAALARETAAGPQVREEIIRRALAQIPADASRASNGDPQIFRAKSLLLFYALRDRVGAGHFHDAMQHMLAARRSRGFDITDLIAAIEEESHQPIGPFVREWLKRPGVPEEFRARYPLQSAAKKLTRSGGDTVKDIVLTDKGPKPIGPYSQAIKSNGFLFASGQVALDPKTNEFFGGDIRQQTERVLENIKAIVEAAGSNLHHVVKTTVFLTNMSDFAAMNEIYAKYFATAPPARATVEVARLPKDALVEIEVIASL